MSVLKSKRTESKYEYIHTFETLYKHTKDKLSKLAKRKVRWLGEPIVNQMNEIYNHIMQVYDTFLRYGIKLMDIGDQADLIINELKDLQKSLLALWNVERYEERKMVAWADLINDEIMYVSRLKGAQEGRVNHIFILDYKAVNTADFVKTMCELHRLIYTKTISLPNMERNTEGILLMKLADEALYRICRANRFAPTNQGIAEFRVENLSIAFDCLHQMQMPLLSIFNLMKYSENTMQEIVSALNKEIKLLGGVIRSDKKRFELSN